MPFVRAAQSTGLSEAAHHMQFSFTHMLDSMFVSSAKHVPIDACSVGGAQAWGDFREQCGQCWAGAVHSRGAWGDQLLHPVHRSLRLSSNGCRGTFCETGTARGESCMHCCEQLDVLFVVTGCLVCGEWMSYLWWADSVCVCPKGKLVYSSVHWPERQWCTDSTLQFCLVIKIHDEAGALTPMGVLGITSLAPGCAMAPLSSSLDR